MESDPPRSRCVSHDMCEDPDLNTTNGKFEIDATAATRIRSDIARIRAYIHTLSANPSLVEIDTLLSVADAEAARMAKRARP